MLWNSSCHLWPDTQNFFKWSFSWQIDVISARYTLGQKSDFCPKIQFEENIWIFALKYAHKFQVFDFKIAQKLHKKHFYFNWNNGQKFAIFAIVRYTVIQFLENRRKKPRMQFCSNNITSFFSHMRNTTIANLLLQPPGNIASWNICIYILEVSQIAIVFQFES